MISYLISGFFNYLLLSPVCIVAEIILYRNYKKQKIKPSMGFLIGWQAFACLMLMIFSVTGTAGLGSVCKYGTRWVGMEEINFIPFFMWGRFDSYGLIMNIILFLPLGILLPVLWESGKRMLTTVSAGFLLSLLVEISQLFNFRATDIDDLMMNTLGAFLGYILYLLFFRKLSLFCLNGGKIERRGEAIRNVLYVFLVYVLIGEPLREVIYQIIYR